MEHKGQGIQKEGEYLNLLSNLKRIRLGTSQCGGAFKSPRGFTLNGHCGEGTSYLQERLSQLKWKSCSAFSYLSKLLDIWRNLYGIRSYLISGSAGVLVHREQTNLGYSPWLGNKGSRSNDANVLEFIAS